MAGAKCKARPFQKEKQNKPPHSTQIAQTWNPSYVHDPNFITQVCSSKGKYSTSISHEDLQMAGGFHSTSPLYHKVAFVASVTSKFPSALKNIKDQINVWESQLPIAMKDLTSVKKHYSQSSEVFSKVFLSSQIQLQSRASINSNRNFHEADLQVDNLKILHFELV